MNKELQVVSLAFDNLLRFKSKSVIFETDNVVIKHGNFVYTECSFL